MTASREAPYSDLFAASAPEAPARRPAADARLHPCRCGAWGSFGFRRPDGVVRWACAAHRDELEKAAA